MMTLRNGRSLDDRSRNTSRAMGSGSTLKPLLELNERDASWTGGNTSGVMGFLKSEICWFIRVRGW